MAYDKWKNETGQGGKLGHSNMSHWEYTEWLKVCSKVNRRLESKKIIRDIDIDNFEIEIEITFVLGLSESENDTFYDQFIGLMEGNKLLFGGGGDKSGIQGCIDYSSSNFVEKDIIDIMNDFSETHRGVIERVVLRMKNHRIRE